MTHPFAGRPIDEVRSALREFIANDVIPMEREVRLTYDQVYPKNLLRSVWRRSRDRGFYGINLPAALGGLDISVHDLCLLKMDAAASGALLCQHVLGDMGGPLRVGNIIQYATPAQLEEFFMPVLRGDKAACYAMTEPQSGSDAMAIKTSAVRDGDHYVVNGHKHYITAAAFSDFAITLCVTDPGKGADGVTALLIDLDSPGVRRLDDYVPITGQHIDADILFENVRVPAANVLGNLGEGFRLGMKRINVNRLLHCPTMIGFARHSFQSSIDYASTRIQGGGPIARYQAIQHMLADMAAALHACESMTLATARNIDAGKDIRAEAAMCKLFVSERCFEIADKAVQIHGNVGVTLGHPVEQAFRMLRLYRIVTGTSEIQRNTIAKAILPPAVTARGI
jgi:alkylation response protein AidB-like acyl-CoA dehydrogenase